MFKDIFVFVIGILGASYLFSKDIYIIGLLFVIVAIIGLLMNPPERQKEYDHVKDISMVE